MFCHLYVCFRKVTRGEKRDCCVSQAVSCDLTYKHDIILIYTNNIVPLLDILALPAPCHVDAALTRADRVTVQTVVD